MKIKYIEIGNGRLTTKLSRDEATYLHALLNEKLENLNAILGEDPSNETVKTNFNMWRRINEKIINARLKDNL